MSDNIEKCDEGGRKHTPIVSEAQRGLFGSELARRRKGEEGTMKGITVGELEGHLKGSGGKDLHKAQEVEGIDMGISKKASDMSANIKGAVKTVKADPAFKENLRQQVVSKSEIIAALISKGMTTGQARDAKIVQDWHERGKKDMAAWKPLPESRQAPVSAFGQTKVDPNRDYAHDRALSKALVIVDLVKTSGVPAGWVGKSAKCPHCDSEVMQSHPMQTLHKEISKAKGEDKTLKALKGLRRETRNTGIIWPDQEAALKKASSDVMNLEREKISREHPHGVDWARVTREGARGRDPSARLRQLVSQRLPATMIPKRDKYDPKRGGE